MVDRRYNEAVTRVTLRNAILIFAAAVLLLTGCGKKEEKAAPPAPPPAPPVVQVAKPAPEEAPVFTAIATLDGSTSTEIRARGSGYLVRQDYQDEEAVKRGDLLFELDARQFLADLKKAKADMADKVARVVTKDQLDAARSSVGAAQRNVDGTKIFAPRDGVAGRAVPGLGDLVNRDTLLTTISTVDPIRVAFALPRKVYPDNPEQIAQASFELLLADGTLYPEKGKFDHVDLPAQTSPGAITVYVFFPNPDLVLRPGQYAKVRVTVRAGQ